MKTAAWILLAVLVIVLIGAGLYFNSRLFMVNNLPASSPSPSTSIRSTPSSGPDQTTSLPTKYITAVDWPPKVQTLPDPFTCTEAGSETDRAGQTKSAVINSRTYCVTKITEGAAGSIYTQYAYALPENNGTKIYTYSLKSPQCGNFSEPEKTGCEEEKESFNIDNFIDQYIQNSN